MKKEGFCVIKELLFFKSKVIIKCDNCYIIFLKENFNSRVQRWKVLLEEFDYKIKFLNGNCRERV